MGVSMMEDGPLHLEGSVPSLQDRQLATEVAMDAVGHPAGTRALDLCLDASVDPTG